jgi:hypothetical protein
MNNFDYYTVMESKIKHFSQKYDPQNKLGNAINKTKIGNQKEKPKRPIRKKILIGLETAMSFFL